MKTRDVTQVCERSSEKNWKSIKEKQFEYLSTILFVFVLFVLKIEPMIYFIRKSVHTVVNFIPWVTFALCYTMRQI